MMSKSFLPSSHKGRTARRAEPVNVVVGQDGGLGFDKGVKLRGLPDARRQTPDAGRVPVG